MPARTLHKYERLSAAVPPLVVSSRGSSSRHRCNDMTNEEIKISNMKMILKQCTYSKAFAAYAYVCLDLLVVVPLQLVVVAVVSMLLVLHFVMMAINEHKLCHLAF